MKIKCLDVLVCDKYSLLLYPTKEIAVQADKLYPHFEATPKMLSQLLGQFVFQIERLTPFVVLEQSQEYIKVLSERGITGWIGPFSSEYDFSGIGIKPFGNMV